MKVVWSPRAIARATEIATYIAADRPAAAGRWVDELLAGVASLKDHPRRGRRVPEVGRAAVCAVLQGAYRRDLQDGPYPHRRADGQTRAADLGPGEVKADE